MISRIISKHNYHVYSHDIVAFELDPISNVSLLNVNQDLSQGILGYNGTIISELLNSGDQCFICHINNEIAGMCMGHTGPCYINGPALYLPLNVNEVYIYWIIVNENIRGAGIYNKIYKSFNNYYSNNGSTKFYYLVDCNNTNMVNIANKQKLVLNDTVTTYKLLNKLVIKKSKRTDKKLSVYFTDKYKDCHKI